MTIVDDSSPLGANLSPALALCVKIVRQHIWAFDELDLDPDDGQAALEALVHELETSVRPVWRA